VFGTFSSGASDDRSGRTGTAVWIRSFKYAGVEEDIILTAVGRPYNMKFFTVTFDNAHRHSASR